MKSKIDIPTAKAPLTRVLRVGAFLLVAVVAAAACSRGGDLPSGTLDGVDAAMADIERISRICQGRLDSLRRVASQTTDPDTLWTRTMRLSDEWRLVNADSSLKYSQRAIVLAGERGDSVKVFQSRVNVVKSLATAGLFSEARHTFDKAMEEAPDSAALKIDLWLAGRMLYSYMGSYTGGESALQRDYQALSESFDDSIMANMPDTSMLHSFLKGERLVSVGRRGEAGELLEALMKRLSPDNNLYAMTAYQLACVYQSRDDDAKAVEYLARAAECDLRSSVHEGLALPGLAFWLYQHGYPDKAFSYVNRALQEAQVGSARMRAVSIASMLPAIDEAYRRELRNQNTMLTATAILSTLLLLLSGVLLFTLIRRHRVEREARTRLAYTSRLQQSYIGTFLGLCSTYAERLDAMSKLVGRKLAAGQAEELQKMAATGRLADAGNEDFYRVFDHAFLDLYPDFIDEVNALLRPEAAMEKRADGSLQAELRIYAMVTLGVDESTRIARILRYSVSTVYAYRNRMRNRAIDRENFEREIAGLHSRSN